MRGLRWLGLVVVLASLGASCNRDCRGSLREVGVACPATFDGTEAQLPSCPSVFSMSARQCGDLIELELGNLSGTQCVYDARSHALVGAMIYTDINAYCDGDSFTKVAGRLPDMSCSAVPFAIRKTCSPAAAPDGAAAD
jgi:hypothetical protein